MPQAQPELKKVDSISPGKFDQLTERQYLDKRLFVQLNGSRKVLGVLRGYDVRDIPLVFPSMIRSTSLKINTTNLERMAKIYITGVPERRPRRCCGRESRRGESAVRDGGTSLHYLTECEGSSITILIGVVVGHPRELSSDVRGMSSIIFRSSYHVANRAGLQALERIGGDDRRNQG